MSSSSDIRQYEQSKDEVKDDMILFRWRNPNPSMSLKCSGSNFDVSSIVSSHTFELRISCCIGGYRIVQLPCGNSRAEFQFILSYGSRSFNCWKSFTEFKKLHEIVKYAHISNDNYPESVKEWRILKAKQKWYRCLSVIYLIEKSVFLGRYMQALLMESESPGLLLHFVQTEGIGY